MRLEDIMQATCFEWFHNTYHKHRQMLFHVDNNSQNAIVGARKKALGVTKGVVDLILVVDLGRTIWIELKTATGTLSDKQKDFRDKLIERGHIHIVLKAETKEEMLDKFKQLVWQLIGKL